MPFKSKAQRRKFAELLVKGEIKPETYEEWNRDTGRKELPERVTRTRGKKRKGAKRSARRKAASPSRSGTRKATRATRRSKRTGARKTTRKARRTARSK